MNGPELLPGLRDELVRAGARRVRRRRVARRIVVLGSVLVVVVAGLLTSMVFVGGRSAQAGVEISEEDGRITVLLTDIETRPSVVQQALRDAGIDATVDAKPVGPTNVGRFLSSAEGFPPGTDIIEPGTSSFPGFSIPVGVGGEIHLLLGRAADPGEDYFTWSDALLPGEPLACVPLLGGKLSDVEAVAAAHPELTVVVQLWNGNNFGVPVEASTLETRPLIADWHVSGVQARSSDDVLVYYSPDDDDNPPVYNPFSGRC